MKLHYKSAPVNLAKISGQFLSGVVDSRSILLTKECIVGAGFCCFFLLQPPIGFDPGFSLVQNHAAFGRRACPSTFRSTEGTIGCIVASYVGFSSEE